MSDSDSDPDRDSSKSDAPPLEDRQLDPVPNPNHEADLLQTARSFLQDDQVKQSSRSKKTDYLREKGLKEEDITTLLDEDEAEPEVSAEPEASTPQVQTQKTNDSRPTPSSNPLASSHPDEPPIITYPEFLTKPTRPPPLVTGTALLNTLYACAGLSTLLYGTSKYFVAPMVDSLTDARSDLHESASTKLEVLIRQLEGTVSEIPPTVSASAKNSNSNSNDPDHVAQKDNASITSSDDDPTELFHRDIGVQTSLPPSPSPDTGGAGGTARTPDENASAPTRHAAKLAALSSNLRDLRTAYVAQSEDLADVKSVMDLFKDDLGTMTFPGPGTAGSDSFVGSFSLYGGAGGKKNEPADEIKKARDNIRRVKGVMLSTRNFPTSSVSSAR